MNPGQLKIAIVDDNSLALSSIHAYVQSYFKDKKILCEVKTFQDSDSFEQSNERFDLLLCDIGLPGKDGITLATEKAAQNENMDVVFISNYEEKVFDCMKIHPLGFVRKDHFFTDISNILDYFYKKLDKAKLDHFLIVKSNSASIKLNIQDIIYIEAKQHNQVFHLNNQMKTLVVNENMKTFVSSLEKYGFIHCHKSYLVNCLYIQEISQNTIILTNDEAIYVSKRRVADIKNQFMKWSLEQ